jgi:hypothetical protein
MPYPDTGRVANQVFTWGQTGLLDVAPDQASIERSSSLAALDDETAPAEDRLRSYWASNCSMCHRGSETAPGIFAAWDARYEVPLQDQGVIDGRLAESAPDDDARVVVPGDLDKSVLYQRSNSTLPGYAMPPLGRSSVDPKYVALLEEWIRSLSPSQGPTP